MRRNRPVEIPLARTHNEVKLRLIIKIPGCYARLLSRSELERIKRLADAGLTMLDIMANEHDSQQYYQQMTVANEPVIDQADPVNFTLVLNADIDSHTVDDWLYSLIVEPVLAETTEHLEPKCADRFAKRRRHNRTLSNSMLWARTPDDFTTAVLSGPAFETHENVLALFD